MKFFNTAGPVNCEDHYCIPPLIRFDLDEVRMLIDQKKYFVLHAPRQTGKTSTLIALADYLNNEGRYSALYVNIEEAQAAREDVDAAMRAVISSIAEQAELVLDDSRLSDTFPDIIAKHGGYKALRTLLRLWASDTVKPTVLFLDEVDSLVGDTLISLLRQIRSGYTDRPKAFPQSIILCGVRDVRDYRIGYIRQKIKKSLPAAAHSILKRNLSVWGISLKVRLQPWFSSTPKKPARSSVLTPCLLFGNIRRASPGWSMHWLMKPVLK